MALSKEVLLILQRVRNNDPSLKLIYLAFKGLGVNGARELATALEHNNIVTELDMQCNEIGDEGVEALVRVLRLNSTITHLFLGNNGIHDRGGEALAQLMRQNRTIKILGLSDNRIEEEGARSLARALLCNHTLKSLDLPHNSIGDGGAEAMACALQLNSTLTRLEVYKNEIGGRGSRALANAARNLGEQDVGEENITAFAEGLFGEVSPVRLGLEDIGTIRQHIAVANPGEGQLVIQSYLEGVPSRVNRSGQLELLKAAYAASKKWGVKQVMQESCSVKDEVVGSMLHRVGLIIGVAGIFGILRENPKLCMPHGALDTKMSGKRKREPLS